MNPPRIEAAGAAQLQVAGELTFATVTALHGRAKALFAQQNGDFAIDLAGVSRADSAGVALLIEWLRWGRQHGVTLQFRHVPEQLRTIASASNLEQILPLEG